MRGSEERYVEFTEGEQWPKGGRESREGRYRNISSQDVKDGMGGAKIGMTMVGRRAGVIADTMTCLVVKRYRSTRVQSRIMCWWVVVVRFQVQLP